MYSRVELAFKYLHYFLNASNGRGHGIHSPFVYDFITHVLRDSSAPPEYALVENLRRQLRKNRQLVLVEDLGAGSSQKNSAQRTIASLAVHAAKPKKYGQLLHRMARYYQPECIIELGTSLGLSTAYLASGNPAAEVFTLEGAPAVADLAAAHFRQLGLTNIKVFRGHFDDRLPEILSHCKPVGLAFIDGNHRREPTLQYFEMLLDHAAPGTVLIFDDIHWSAEMESAWTAIKAHPDVLLTVDLFFIGMIFIREGFHIKQHFTIRF